MVSEKLVEMRREFTDTDRDVIGTLFQEMDEGKDFVSGDDNYVWFYLIGKLFKPKVIAEMGSRFGYSMKCFVEGAGHDPKDVVVRSFDAECDGIKTLDTFQDYFKNVLGVKNIKVTRADTQKLKTLWMDGEADLCMVDGMHTVEGCYHECELAWDALKSGGVMVVDDINFPLPKEGLDKFCASKGVYYEFIESFRGIALVVKP